MARKIVILEDNEDRRAAMQRCLDDRLYQYETRFFDAAAEMTQYLDAHLGDSLVISLDHDLELKPGPAGGLTDPGTGRDVADYLAGKAPVCPVVIHTSNSAAAAGMKMVLREAGWPTRRVLPFDDREWIPRQWFRAIRRAIGTPEALSAREGGGSRAVVCDPDGRHVELTE